MKKVVHVLNHFLPHQTAGTEVYTWALVKASYALGIEGSVVIPNYGKKNNETYVYDGIKVYQYAETSLVDRSLIMGKRNPDGLPYFEQLLQQIQPDVVHFHELAGSNGITLAHVQAAKDLGMRVIMTFHLAGYTCKTGSLMYKDKILCNGKIDVRICGSCYLHQKERKSTKRNELLLGVSTLLMRMGIDSTNWNTRIGTALGTTTLIKQLKERFQLLTHLCDEMVSLTNWYRTILVQNGVPISKVTLIKQGLPTSTMLPAATSMHLSGRQPGVLHLLFVGRISAFKGLHIMLEAMMSLPKNKVMLSIYGQVQDSSYANYWQNKTKDYHNIKWGGQLNPEMVVPTMQAYDVLCLCSTFSEMSPLVIQEAFSAKLPVIASNVYGNAEQVQHGVNGWLFRFNDSKDLAEQIQHIISNPKELDRVKNNILSPLPFSEIARQYMQVYWQGERNKTI